MTIAVDPTSPTMPELLDLEQVGHDEYRGVNEQHPDAPAHLFGGQIAAQALRAAGLTVAPDRHPHSLHAYFLRRGLRAERVDFSVLRDRDGRSFSSRRVSATQDGEVIFHLAASFHVDEETGTYSSPPPEGWPEPEDQSAPKMVAVVSRAQTMPVPPTRLNIFGAPESDRIWVKIRDALGSDRLIQACALTYLSDVGTGFANLDVPGLPMDGPSIDHALWFREPIPADDWVMLDMKPMVAGGARGLYTGTMHGRDGRHGATLAQEIVMRPQR